MMRWSIFNVICGYLFINIVGCIRKEKIQGTESRLFQDLFEEYNYDSRPVENASKTVHIEFRIALNQILDLEEKHQVLSTAVWIYEVGKHIKEHGHNDVMLAGVRDYFLQHSIFNGFLGFISSNLHYKLKVKSWYADNLMWDPSKYNNLDTLIIPSTKIWLPDLFLFNTAGENLDGFVNVTGSKVMVHHDGLVRWMIPIMLKSSCSVDVTYFPYDYQKCELRFGSWIYDITQVDMHLKESEVDISDYIVNSEYDLINASVTRNMVDASCCPGGGTHTMISIYIHVKRKSLYYDYIVIAPTIMLCFMTLFTFLLPCHKGEKIAIGLTVFLTLYVVQLFIAENVPDTNSTPILGVFLLMVMTFNCGSLIMATLIMNIKKQGEQDKCGEVPNWLLWLSHVVLSKIALTSFIWEKPVPILNGNDNSAMELEGHSNLQNRQFENGENMSNVESDTTHIDNPDVIATESVVRVRNRKFISDSERNDVVTEPMMPKQNIKNSRLGKHRDSIEYSLYNRRQWFYVAEVVDKFSFLIYLISMSFSILMVLFVIPHYFSDA